MRAADGGPDQPQASSQCRIRPERQELSPAVAANRVSGPRTQPWKVRRRPGSQPKVRPGTVAAADLSRFPEGATPALCPGGRRYESCTAHHLFQGSPDGHASAVPSCTTRDRQLADSNPGLPTSLLELLRWFDIPQHAQEDVAKACDRPVPGDRRRR